MDDKSSPKIFYIGGYDMNGRILKWFLLTGFVILTVGCGRHRLKPAETGAFSYPQAITADPKGDLFIVDLRNSRIVILHPGDTVRATIQISSPPLGSSTGIAVSPSGEIFVSDQSNQRVLVFNPDGTLSKTITDLSPLSPNTFGDTIGLFPQGIAISPDGHVYIADQTNNRIVVLHPNGTVSGSISSVAPYTPSTLSNVLDGITVSPSGKIYVSDHEYNRLVVFGPDGTPLSTITNLSPLSPDRFHGPRGLAFTPDGDLYVTDCYNVRIIVLNPDGTALKSFRTSNNCPQGIAYSASTGYLYTAQSDDSVIEVFNLDGTPRQPIRQFQIEN
jgi:DNA-binding beta-propeller fold protein YncE